VSSVKSLAAVSHWAFVVGALITRLVGPSVGIHCNPLEADGKNLMFLKYIL
jgi:hypothetical protein